MTSALETIRYHLGIAREEVADMVDSLEREVSSLREQVEKLTKERDELKTVPMKYRRMQFNAELPEEVTQLQEQLAAFAEQNTKMRETLQELYELLPVGVGIASLSLPDLATPVLNRIRAEGMRMAAEICDSPMDRAAAEIQLSKEKQNG